MNLSELIAHNQADIAKYTSHRDACPYNGRHYRQWDEIIKEKTAELDQQIKAEKALYDLDLRHLPPHHQAILYRFGTIKERLYDGRLRDWFYGNEMQEIVESTGNTTESLQQMIDQGLIIRRIMAWGNEKPSAVSNPFDANNWYYINGDIA